MRYRNIRRFDGGRVSLDALDVGSEALNMIRDGTNIRTRSGAIVGRKGSITYSDFGLTGIAGDDIGPVFEYRREYDSAGDSAMFYAILFSIDGKFYYTEIEDDPDVIVVMSPELNSGDFYAVNCFDYMFVATGKDPVKLFDGDNDFINCQMVEPAALTLNTIVTAGTKIRKYKYTYFADQDPTDKESPDSDVLTQTGLGVSGPQDSPHLTIDYTQATDAQVTHYKIYATELYDPADTPPTDYYLLDTIGLAAAIAASFVYTDVTCNTNLVLKTLYDTTDRGVPPEVKYLLWHNSVMYGAGEEDNPNILYRSLPSKPFYWDTDHWDGISRDDGDVITGLGAIGNTRYIFKTNSIWQQTGDPATAAITAVERPDASMNMTRLGIGCADPRSLAAWLNTLIFRASDNHVYMLTNDAIIQLTVHNTDWMDNLSQGAISCVYDDYYIISQGLFTYVCDLRKREYGWVCRDNPVQPTNFLIDHNGYCLGSSGDTIIRYYTGTTDQGSVIAKEAQSAYAALAIADAEALIREAIVEDRNRDGDYTASVYNEDGTLLNTGAYKTSDRKFYVGGGRGNFASVKMAWTGTANILSMSIGYLLRRRH